MNDLDKYGYFYSIRKTGFSPITDSHKDDIEATRQWIRSVGFKKTPRVRRLTDSYKLKHFMERHCGKYVLNGVFIQAMIDEGFTAKQINNGPNANFNLDLKKHRDLK
jgi:hypothetical protein